MAHKMTQHDSLIVADTASWHGLEHAVIPGGIPIAEAFNLSRLNWKVGIADAVRAFFKQEDGTFHKLESDARVVYRLPSEFNQDYIEFGTVGKDYTLIQNEVLFELAEKAFGEGLIVESAGSFSSGRVVYVTMRGETIGYKNDASKRFLSLTTSHDGTVSLTALPHNTRIVCNNTWRSAIRQAKTTKYTIRHTMGADEQVREMTKALELYKKQGEFMQEQQIAMSSVKANSELIYKFFSEQYAKLNPKANLADSEEMIKAKETIESWESTMASEMLELSEDEPTIWLMANAITKDVQYAEPKRKQEGWQDRRGLSVLDGLIAKTCNEIFLDALELV